LKQYVLQYQKKNCW